MWYGIWYWIIGGVLALVQFSGTVHPVVGQLIFYGFAFLAPLILASLFFARVLGTPTWVFGIRLAASWVVLFTVLDVVVLVWWLEFPLQAYLSWQLAFAYGVLFVLCAVIAGVHGRIRRSRGPEGLA